MKSDRARHAMQWLEQAPAYARVSEHGRRMLDLQADVRRIVPTLPLTVLALDDDALVVAAPHAAIAAKLRQYEPSLIRGLAERGWRVQRIRFRPQLPTGAPPAARRAPKPAVPASALETLDELAAHVDSDSPLKRALARMIARHRGSLRR